MPGLFDDTPRLTRLRLPIALHDALLAQARATPTVEICGLLGGRDDVATSRYAVHNVADDPVSGFLVDARGQLRAMKAMRDRGETLVGIYHSHPTGPARPSALDRSLAAYPGVAYLIVSLADPGQAVLGSFVFDGSDFAPLPLVIG
ncbi:MAG: M67 family metallopeptidase [Gammaproteobacteria bacterium]|jgi:proteasome lid subunit RPN8/RPN11|nr:M67 family metallopeptidase [Gammaproteobacteria bacterium]